MVFTKKPNNKNMTDQLGFKGKVIGMYQLRDSVKIQLESLLYESQKSNIQTVIQAIETSKFTPLQKLYLLSQLNYSYNYNESVYNQIRIKKLNLIIDNIDLIKVDYLLDNMKPLLFYLITNKEFETLSIVLNRILGLLKSSGIKKSEKDIISYEIENIYLDNVQLFNDCINTDLKQEMVNLILTIAKYCSNDCLLNQCLDEGINDSTPLEKQGIITAIIVGSLFLTLSAADISYASGTQGEKIKESLSTYEPNYNPKSADQFYDRKMINENFKFIIDNGKKLLSDYEFSSKAYFSNNIENSTNYEKIQELKQKYYITIQKELNLMYEAINTNLHTLQDYKSKVTYESQKNLVTKTSIAAIDKLIKQLNILLDKLILLEKKLNNEIEL